MQSKEASAREKDLFRSVKVRLPLQQSSSSKTAPGVILGGKAATTECAVGVLSSGVCQYSWGRSPGPRKRIQGSSQCSRKGFLLWSLPPLPCFLGHRFVKKYSWEGESVCTSPPEHEEEVIPCWNQTRAGTDRHRPMTRTEFQQPGPAFLLV